MSKFGMSKFIDGMVIAAIALLSVAVTVALVSCMSPALIVELFPFLLVLNIVVVLCKFCGIL